MRKSLLRVFGLAAFAFMGISAQAQETVPYRASFETSDAGWTTIDASTKPGTTWKYTEYGLYASGYYYHCVETSRDFDACYDDYFVSPAITLEKGKTYTVQTATAGAGTTTAMTLTLELGTSATDASTFSSLATLPMENAYTAGNPESYEVTVEETGTYHFAFHAVNQDPSTSVRAYLFNFYIMTDDEGQEPGQGGDPEPVEHHVGDVVYTNDFSATDALSDWTVLDSNADGTTWGVVEGVGNATYDSDQATVAANDWLISPAVTLQNGMDYIVSYTFAQQGAFDEDLLSVHAGDAPTADEMVSYLNEESISASGTTFTGQARYTCTADGKKYFGFHLTTPNAENGQLTLTSFTVTAAEAATPQPVEDLEGELTEDKTVILRWTCPTKDTEDIVLVQPIGINIYENDALIKTYEEVSPGQQGFEVVTPTATGKVTYKVEAFIGDNKSEGKTVEINLEDEVGTEELVKTFDVSSTAKSDWVIEDNAGTGAWKYDYQNIFSFDYKNGNKDQDDWLISPAVDLSASKRYLLKYDLKTGRDYGTDITVTIGKEQNSAAQTQTLANYPELKQNGFETYQTEQFAVAESGTYYVGFHVTTANYYVSVRNVQVYVINNTATGIERVNSSVIGYNRSQALLAVPAGASQVAVYSANGTLVESTVANGQTIDLSPLASGVYVVTVKDAQGNNYRMKIAK